MRADELDFELPPELVAQAPAGRREASRLLHYRRADRSVWHRAFSDLPSLLRPGDLLVFNDARVLPARFALRKRTGGLVEGLYLDEPAPGQWHALLRNVGRGGAGQVLDVDLAPGFRATILSERGAGAYVLSITGADGRPQPAAALLERIGRMPLPPYIRRAKGRDERDDLDRDRYQTVFARAPGAVAAPTAALHFSDALLASLDRAGVRRAFVTLDVGLGTFKPVTADDLDDHVMHVERYAVDAAAAAELNAAEAEGRRVVAVGTTAARVLESRPAGEPFRPAAGETGIFIRPPYAWRHVDALVTNFHLPRSTLIALVAALVGVEEQRRLYRLAVDEKYRFFSYGDATFVE